LGKGTRWGAYLTLNTNLLICLELIRAFLFSHITTVMTRSLSKGPYVDERVLKKIEGKNPMQTGVIKTWSRACQIAPEMVGFTFGVHNGKTHVEVLVTEDMVGHRLGEFSPTKKFVRHGGKMQKELEAKKKEAEIAAAKGAKESSDAKPAKK
jgi:small subunit ribosomal protein S19